MCHHTGIFLEILGYTGFHQLTDTNFHIRCDLKDGIERGTA